MLRGRAQLLQTFLTARFRVDADYGLGSRQPAADPRAVAEQQLQSVGADDLADRVPAELARIGPQLLSELRLDLGRQAEVLRFGIEEPTWLHSAFNCSPRDLPLRATASQQRRPARTPSFSGT